MEYATSSNKEVEEEIKELTKDNDNLKNYIDQIQNEIEDLEMKNEQLESEKNDLEEKAEELCREIYDLKQTCSQEQAIETMDRYSNKIKALENSLESQVSENESLRNELQKSNLAKSNPIIYPCGNCGIVSKVKQDMEIHIH